MSRCLRRQVPVLGASRERFFGERFTMARLRRRAWLKGLVEGKALARVDVVRDIKVCDPSSGASSQS
eukprot:10769444-Alexandrium_andersonii.AAC.1